MRLCGTDSDVKDGRGGDEGGGGDDGRVEQKTEAAYDDEEREARGDEKLNTGDNLSVATAQQRQIFSSDIPYNTRHTTKPLINLHCL